jgi:hypothetical protein
MKTITRTSEIYVADDGKIFDDSNLCWNYDVTLKTYWFRLTKPDWTTDLYKIVGTEKFVDSNISQFLRKKYGPMFGAENGQIVQKYSIDMLHQLTFQAILDNDEYMDFYTLRVSDLGLGFELNTTCDLFDQSNQNLENL